MEGDSQVLATGDRSLDRCQWLAGRRKMECSVCNMKGSLGFFSFLFLFLAWAFEPCFILYTLPGCQAQAEVNEPDVGWAPGSSV